MVFGTVNKIFASANVLVKKQVWKFRLNQIRNKRFVYRKAMPKNKTATSELRELRLKNKNSGLSKSPFPPSELYLCVLGNGGNSSSRALYMFTDHGRYLFNCGEGTQRLAQEYKMKLAKLDHIFITHKSWANLGGLLGLSLTIQDIGVPEINLHGPPGIELLYENSKSFVITKDLNIVKRNVMDEAFVDSCMEVHYIKILSSSKHQASTGTSSDSDLETGHGDCDSPASSKHKSKKLRVSDEFYKDMAVAYLCKGHNKPGHLLIEKCVEQGVPPGPLLGDLKNGKDVILPSGKTVYSKDVVSDEQPCPVFLVVECPSEKFLDPFVNEEKFEDCQRNSTKASNIASLVVHFTPPNILHSAKYQEWMKRFPDNTYHMVINNDNATLSSSAIHRIQQKLNLLHPEIFPLLQEREAKIMVNGILTKNVIQANTLDRYYLRPAKGYDKNFAVSVDPEEFIDEAMNADGFVDSLKHLQKRMQNSETYKNDDIYPEAVFLGTGSSVPSKVRNVSAILINLSEEKSLLMDCGEGTCGQLMRMYGKVYLNKLMKVVCIFISHMHADHHLGLIQFLKYRKEAFINAGLQYVPVLLIGPKNLHSWLKQYHKSFEKISPLDRFFPCSLMEYGHLSSLLEQSDIFQNLRDINLYTVPVNHCPDAHGIILCDKASKWKLVYSGDTTPCEKLVIAGKDCTLLIHEATMEDELADEAALKRHSTTSDAIRIGEKMNSSYIILTHFSQRYAKVPVFDENFGHHVGCAFDNMKVRPRDLPILPLLIPTLKCLFAEHVEELNIKGSKRRKKIGIT